MSKSSTRSVDREPSTEEGRTTVVSTDVQGEVAIISLQRAHRLNALTGESLIQLRDAFRHAGDSPQVKAVVFRGEGRAFCAGLDIEAGLVPSDSADDPVEASHSALAIGVEVIALMRSIPQPVIAVVQGHAVGGGFALAAAADIRIIGADAQFSVPFLRLGMSVGDLGLSWFLPRMIGLARASRLFYEAGSLDAEQAVEWGLATSISPAPLEEALEVAHKMAAFPPYGVHASKQLINASPSSSLRDHLDAEMRAQVIGLMTDQAAKAMENQLSVSKTPLSRA